MGSCSVVIVSYDTEEHVLRCLASLKSHVPQRGLHFIVVDNSPEPATTRIRDRYPEVTILRPGQNLGFAGGSNRGIRLALEEGAEHILLLNPDTIAEEDFLSPLAEVLEQDPTVAAVAPKILVASPEREVYFAGSRMNWWLGGPRHVLEDREVKDPWVSVPFLSGCALLLSARAVRRIGEMDERYFLYFEDADYIQRLLAAGYQAAYVPGSTLLHAVSGSIDRRGSFHTYVYARSRVYFMRRWAKWYHLVVFFLYTILVKAPGAWLVFGLSRRRPDQARAFCRGSLDGLWLAAVKDEP